MRDMSPNPADIAALAAPLRLRSGLVLPNRLAKSATSERLADRRGAPGERLARLYQRWGTGGAGLLITGNVIVDPSGPEAPRNVIADDADADAYRAWARAAQSDGSRLVMQIGHAGRQSPRSATRTSVGPSAVPLGGAAGTAAAAPRALTEREIEYLIACFARTAALARAAGFAGVQVHGAHGYLINQFLSPLANQRTDRWGGSLDNRMRFLLAVLRAVQESAGPGFSVSLKLNSADFQRGGFDTGDSQRVAEAVDAEGIDFLEISGGNYESTAMFGGDPSGVRDSTRRREAYFLAYAEEIRARVRVPLLLTGGFRSATAMAAAVTSGAVDLVGLARPMIVEPDLPARLLSGAAAAAIEVDLRVRSKFLDDLIQATWYARQLRRMGDGRDPDPTMGRAWALIAEGIRSYGWNPLALPARRRELLPSTAS
jgi:2,4-dienoyl-CoA reductase-like NADH-dependent reductase (Old Yellow Enzyme family)